MCTVIHIRPKVHWILPWCFPDSSNKLHTNWYGSVYVILQNKRTGMKENVTSLTELMMQTAQK